MSTERLIYNPALAGVLYAYAKTDDTDTLLGDGVAAEITETGDGRFTVDFVHEHQKSPETAAAYVSASHLDQLYEVVRDGDCYNRDEVLYILAVANDIKDEPTSFVAAGLDIVLVDEPLPLEEIKEKKEA